MKAKIFSNEKLIGTADLKVGDRSMGHVFGEFLPTKNYYTDIQPVVWEFWSTNKPDYIKWELLKLNVQLDNGYFLFAAGGITFNDISELQDEPKSIDIMGIDEQAIEDYVVQEQPKLFVEEPWESISIEQKIAFEDELRKELGTKTIKPFLNIFKSNPAKHILLEFEVSALCRMNDDILFVTRKPLCEKQFAVVHLTWRGSEESQGFPQFTFYDDFDNFKYFKMWPDKCDWEY